jgi:hypothetical protein
MKHHASELEGSLLDTAVARAEGWQIVRPYSASGVQWDHDCWCENGDMRRAVYAVAGQGKRGEWMPSRDWGQAGPIIERERINLYAGESVWCAKLDIETPGSIITREGRGPTPLIAAMRAFVASKLGDEVELP